jgi:hypothetical protein
MAVLVVAGCGARNQTNGNHAVCRAFKDLEASGPRGSKRAAKVVYERIKAASPSDPALRRIADGVQLADTQIAIPNTGDSVATVCHRHGVSLTIGS